MSSRGVTIVVPVYGDWPSLKDCINALKKHVDTDRHRVMLVNDCGPEVEVMESGIKSAIQGLKNFQYYRNGENLGFVGTCNRAVLELDKTTNDILLLNSDTQVTESFLEEMTEVLYLVDNIAAVTPRSNNATLATVPLSAAPQKGINAKESYKLYQKIKSKLPRYYEIPVAHGFCMLIKRQVIQEFGLFDPIFGKGYGEEVDFCQRIKQHGYLSALSNWSYVFHLEARSFTLETKSKLLEDNNKIIWKRYPDYRQSVRDFMAETIAKENEIEKSVGTKTPISPKNQLKKMLKSNRYTYRAAQKARKILRK